MQDRLVVAAEFAPRFQGRCYALLLRRSVGRFRRKSILHVARLFIQVAGSDMGL